MVDSDAGELVQGCFVSEGRHHQVGCATGHAFNAPQVLVQIGRRQERPVQSTAGNEARCSATEEVQRSGDMVQGRIEFQPKGNPARLLGLRQRRFVTSSDQLSAPDSVSTA